MRAAIVNRPGGLDVLEIRETPEPAPAPGEVLIDVAYCGCNWADIQRRQGIYPHPVDYPHVMGREVSGTILSLGAGVGNFALGERVIAILPNSGGYAERCTAPIGLVTRLPAAIPLDVGAAFQVQALTGYHMLHTLRRTVAGETVLLHAASGGVGLFATQLAVKAGATVIGTVGTSGKEARPLDYGAARVVNLNQENFVAVALEMTDGEGVDIAIDSLGAKTLDRTFDAVRTLGQIINIGEAEGTPYDNIRDRVLQRSQSFTRFSLGHVMERPDLWSRGMEYVLAALEDGFLEAPIVDRFPLDDVAEMHRRLESRQVTGKLLLSFVDG
jgi:NADPH:quinone reductase